MDGSPNLADSKAALHVKEENKTRPWSRAVSPERVRESARQAVIFGGGDQSNPLHVLGQHELQFGIFRGQTFKWVAENALGYAGYLVAAMSREDFEKKDSKNHAENKKAFRSYIEQFNEGRYAIKVKSSNHAQRSSTQSSDQSAATLSIPSTASLSTQSTRTSASSTVSQGTLSGSRSITPFSFTQENFYTSDCAGHCEEVGFTPKGSFNCSKCAVCCFN